MQQEEARLRASRARAARRNYIALCLTATAALVAVFVAMMMLYPE
jgi:hypothetical protein